MACACRLAAPRPNLAKKAGLSQCPGCEEEEVALTLDSDTWAMALSTSQFSDICFMSSVGRLFLEDA